MADKTLTFATLRKLVGQEIGVSGWRSIDQATIDAFADCTDDHQWIHVDQERAARESPFGGTVAHGYLTLSLLAPLAYEIGLKPEGTVMSINYGLDRLRFLAPVRAGARVRLRSKLVSVDEKEPGRHLLKIENVMEIEGEERPALIAENLLMLVDRAAAAG